MAGPGELAEGRLPVWGSLSPPAASGGPGSWVPSESGARPPPATTQTGWPSPAAYRAVELPSPTAGQTDCRRAVRPWTRSGGKTRCLTPPADPPGCGPAPGTRLSVRMKAIPAQSGRCYRSCPELPAAGSRATSSQCPARGCCLSSSGRGSRRALDGIRVGLSRRKPNEELFELESRYPRAVPRRGRGLAVSESRSGPLLPSHEFQSHGTGQARCRGYTNSRLPWCPGCCR